MKLIDPWTEKQLTTTSTGVPLDRLCPWFRMGIWSDTRVLKYPQKAVGSSATRASIGTSGQGQVSFLHMSQHHIWTKKYEILIGWDKPLQYFFGTVWDKAQANQDNDEVVFTTLSLPGGGVGTIEELARLLRPYVELPSHITAALAEDQAVNRGNASYEWELLHTDSE
jgi:hypothetical protein